MQQTLVLIKPDAVQRHLIGDILSRFERRGLQIVALKMLRLTQQQAARIYAEHKGKEFFEPLMKFIRAAPVVAVVLRGTDAVEAVRRMIGPTLSREAPPGSIRGDLAMGRRHNLLHGSDGVTAAKREIRILFRPAELLDYSQDLARWVYEA